VYSCGWVLRCTTDCKSGWTQGRAERGGGVVPFVSPSSERSTRPPAPLRPESRSLSPRTLLASRLSPLPCFHPHHVAAVRLRLARSLSSAQPSSVPGQGANARSVHRRSLLALVSHACATASAPAALRRCRPRAGDRSSPLLQIPDCTPQLLRRTTTSCPETVHARTAVLEQTGARQR